MTKFNEQGFALNNDGTVNGYHTCELELKENGTLEHLPTDVLKDALETANYLDFIADMCDDGGQRRAERNANFKVKHPVLQELRARGVIS